MVSSTANVNSTLDKISSATAAAKRAGLKINSAFQGEFFCCISIESNINRAVDLNDKNANTKLAALLEDIYAVTPAVQAMKEAH